MGLPAPQKPPPSQNKLDDLHGLKRGRHGRGDERNALDRFRCWAGFSRVNLVAAKQLHAEHPAASGPRELAFRFTEAALFGSLILERSLRETKLKAFLLAHQDLFRSVCNHIRRLWEGPRLDRFQLLDKVIAWQHQTARVDPS